MKKNHRRLSNSLAACLACASVFLTLQARALDVIDPTGLSYTGVSDSSEYNGSYTAANLFDTDLTGVAVGATLSSSAGEYATAGASSAFVAFQLNQIYTNVGSIFYAERPASPGDDSVASIKIWASTTTPFTAADPGIPAESVVAITNNAGLLWWEYTITNTIAGQYFLIEIQQSVPAGNPGGAQLRLGANLGEPAAIVNAPVDKTVYVGGTARFNASAFGTAPLGYIWSFGGNPLVNGGQVSGAGTENLAISSAALTNAGTYTLTVTNATGTNTATANLTVVADPTNAAVASVIADNPLAFWQLNDPVGSTIALDLAGTYNGTYGSGSGLGASGPQSPAFPGFSATNTAVQTFAFTIDSAVTLPSLNISNTNSVSMLAWIYADDSGGPQQPYTGIVFCRGGTTVAGLICSGDGTQLAYQWGGNRYNFPSGLVLPTNQWSLVALVYTTNATTLYCGSTNGVVLSAVDNYAQAGQRFDGPTYVGLDPDVGESARTFNGSIDDVAFFNRALSSSEIDAIYQAGTGIVPTLQIIGQTATNLSVFQGTPINLGVQVSGLNPAYQWYKQNAPIPGATGSTYSIASAKVSDTGNYYVVVTNQVNSVTSAVVSVTVPDYLVLPIGPSGTIYTGVSASSVYPSAGYSGTNMFDSDLTGVPIGTHLTGNDWADDGYGTAFAPAYLAFQLDQSYPVSAILYAQRNDAGGETIDKATSISVWASQTTPFSAADPGTTPDSVAIPEVDAGILHAYVLPTTVTGQYFVIEVDQDPIVYGSNIGGNEFRLASLVPTVPLAFSNSPAGMVLSWPAAAILQKASYVKGPWVTATGVTNGVPIPKIAAQQFYRILY